ncbi:MAG TPA: hypothetical protein VHZ09_15680 [Acidobacteriaceae bacterium]|nr:hypothetical protein [Acidobacteriaceae bacterium]
MRRMRNWVTVFAALAVMLSARPVLAASDLTGKWTAQILDGYGKPFQLTFEFKQEGTKLTGTLTGPQGDPLAIDNGSVHGDKFSFTVSFNNMTITHEGTISGDAIQMTTKSASPGFRSGQMTLKRWKMTP